MEPIRINVTLDFSERAAALIQKLTGEKVQTAPEPTVPEASIRPVTRPMAQPAPAVPPREEPVATAPVEISDEELRQEVFNARSSFAGAAVKIKNEVFPAFGIRASVDCPMERRAELVSALRNLKP